MSRYLKLFSFCALASQDKSVCNRQVWHYLKHAREHLRVGHVPHGPVPQEDDDQRPIAQHPHHEYEEEQHRHDVRLRSLVVGDDALRGVEGDVVSVGSAAQRRVQA